MHERLAVDLGLTCHALASSPAQSQSVTTVKSSIRCVLARSGIATTHICLVSRRHNMSTSTLVFAFLLALVSFTAGIDAASFNENELLQCLSACPRGESVKAYVDCSSRCKLKSDDDVASKAQIDPQASWIRFRKELIKVLTRGSAENSKIQILTVPMDADWDENPETLTDVCDAVPFASGFYEPSSYTIRDQYRQFIQNIDRGRTVVSQADKDQLDHWTNVYENKSEQLFPAKRECAANYMTDKRAGSTNLEYDEYEKQKCSNFKKINDEIEEALQNMEWYSAMAYGWEYSSLVESRMKSRNLGSMEFKEIGSGLSDFKADAAKGHGTSLSVDLNFMDAKYRKEKYDSYVKGMKRPSSLGGSMFSLMAGPDASGVTTTTDKFSMKLSFKYYKKIRVAPGAWFSQNVIDSFKNGPFIHNQANLFGKNGSMTLLPSAVYVAMKPSVTMTVNKEDAFKFNKSVNKGHGGLFSSKSVTAKIKTKYVSTDTYKMTISSNSEIPQIIAFDYNQL